MEKEQLEGLAKIAYEAHIAAMGTVIPSWEILPENMQKAWVATVKVIEEELNE